LSHGFGFLELSNTWKRKKGRALRFADIKI